LARGREGLQSFIEADKKRKSENGTSLTASRRFTMRCAGFLITRRSWTISGVGESYRLRFYRKRSGAGAAEADLERELLTWTGTSPRRSRGSFSRFAIFMSPPIGPFSRNCFSGRPDSRKPNRIKAVDELFRGGFSEPAIDAYLNKAYEASRMNDAKFVEELLGMSPEATCGRPGSFPRPGPGHLPGRPRSREKQKARRGALDRSMPAERYQRAYLGKSFIPDATIRLRLTYGRIKGYTPGECVYYEPFTTLRGVLEKTTGGNRSIPRPPCFDLSKARDFGPSSTPNSKISPSACFTIPTPPAATREAR